MRVLLVSVTLLVLMDLTLSAKTIFKNCPGGKAVDNLQSKVAISNCTRVPCKLKKKSFVQISMKLNPETNIDKLSTNVNAQIVGVPFPFIGVDGSDACADIYDKEGKNKVGCPLKAGEEYLYLKVIDVLEIYPNIKTVVHWALTSNDGDLLCFEVPARIVS